MPIFTFPTISQMETLSCHSNKGNKKTIFVEVNVMNSSAKFQLRPPYGSEVMIFYIFFCKLSLSFAMSTNSEDWTKMIRFKLW